MITRVFFLLACCSLMVASTAVVASADDTSGDSGPAPYAKFVDGAQVQNGLFNVIRKDGKVYIDIAAAQLGQDFVQTAETANGLGGYNFIPGGIGSYARIIRFTRSDDKIIATWPNTYFLASGNDAAKRAVNQTFADSPVAVAPVVAEDAATGRVVFDASFLLGDVDNIAAQLKQITGPDDPDHAYHLDTDRTLFGPTKAFPQNIIVDADQTWAADDPNTIDNVPDPRSLRIRVVYNFAQPPNDGDYMPRLADDRVGFFDAAYLEYGNDVHASRIVRYVVRWNMQPSDPSKPISSAKHPMVYYLSNTIPTAYRYAVRRSLLTWNAAFEKIGISDAVQVKDQPDDPNWDPDDIRYNTVIWMTQSNSGGYAAENPVFDPRTGQMFRTNIVIDADVLQFANVTAQMFVDPIAGSAGSQFPAAERSFALGKRLQAGFGKVALDVMGRPLTGAALTEFNNELLESFIVHESGHGMGLQHNFIGSLAFTAKQVQSKAFTSRYGVASSVMEYAPLNLWPKGEAQGTYWQTVLGPYDYYVIHWGYARVPGARTPQDEVPVLNRWAQGWANPSFRFASDEDVSYADAHAVDPRVAQWDLTNDPLTWYGSQLHLAHQVLDRLDASWPKPGRSYDEERAAFEYAFGYTNLIATQPEHFIAGEYLSRSHAGDPGAAQPLTQVARSDEERAFGLLDRYLFSDDAWRFSPAMLNRLVYSEWETQQGGTWAYNPPPRHDEPVAEAVSNLQRRSIATMFQPLMLQRLDDLPLKAKPGATMSLADLFDWTQSSVYGDLQSPRASSPGVIHRSLQQWYARMLATLWLTPPQGTPYDAQALARHELVGLRDVLRSATARSGLDELTRAHLESLADVVSRALDARQVIPLKPM
jgi:hypothetical protein